MAQVGVPRPEVARVISPHLGAAIGTGKRDTHTKSVTLTVGKKIKADNVSTPPSP